MLNLNSQLARIFLLMLIASLALHQSASAQPVTPAPRFEKQLPDLVDQSYGPHERNVLDLWKAKSDQPTPLVIFFHGGGFMGGNKTNIDRAIVHYCTKYGISVASGNYRLSSNAPFPAPMVDGARAIQFIRSKAAEWNIDPTRIAAAGNSAGAGISLWIGYRDDLADPKSDDPVLRQSSRITCMGVVGAQSSYDPRFIKNVIGGRAYEHVALPAFYGIKLEELDTPRAYKLYEEAAAINYVNAGDPPVFMYYTEPKEPLPPGPNQTDKLFFPQFGQAVEGHQAPGQGIHHPKFGEVLKEKLDPLGIECIIKHQADYPNQEKPIDSATADMVEFFKRQFKIK